MFHATPLCLNVLYYFNGTSQVIYELVNDSTFVNTVGTDFYTSENWIAKELGTGIAMGILEISPFKNTFSVWYYPGKSIVSCEVYIDAFCIICYRDVWEPSWDESKWLRWIRRKGWVIYVDRDSSFQTYLIVSMWHLMCRANIIVYNATWRMSIRLLKIDIRLRY